MALPAYLQVADNNVVLAGVNTNLMEYVSHLALVHQLLFGENLVITSGKDGQHTAGSLHPLGLAVDLRTRDKSPDAVDLLLHVLSYSAHEAPIAVFDERNVPPAPHLHLEWHGA